MQAEAKVEILTQQLEKVLQERDAAKDDLKISKEIAGKAEQERMESKQALEKAAREKDEETQASASKIRQLEASVESHRSLS